MKAEVRSLTAEVRDSLRVEQVMVAVHDTIVETTTIVVRENEQGDTVKVVQVTDRERLRSMYDVRSKKEEVRVVRDTVFIERRDSVVVRDAANISHHTSAISHLLKCFWGIIIAILTLTITITITRVFWKH